MMNIKKRVDINPFLTLVLLVLLAVFSPQQVRSQEISVSQLSKVDIDNLSDDQIASYWNKSKAEGYTLDQLEVIATSKGMSASQFSKLKQRISNLKYSSPITESPTQGTANAAEISEIEKFGLVGKAPDGVEKSPLFGYDFFSNPKISFTPNLNLATPTSRSSTNSSN